MLATSNILTRNKRIYTNLVSVWRRFGICFGDVWEFSQMSRFIFVLSYFLNLFSLYIYIIILYI